MVNEFPNRQAAESFRHPMQGGQLGQESVNC